MRRNVFLVAAIAAGAGLVAWSGGIERRDHVALRATAREFLEALTSEHRGQAQFAFDDAGRLDWHFIPRERRGLALGAMNDSERLAAHALLHAGLSTQGYLKANGVLTLEMVLQDEVRVAGGDLSFRDPCKYYFSIFGDPRSELPFLVRFEGHHVALNFTSVPSDGTCATPLFFGANPARVRSGPHAGFRLLAGEEDLARALVVSLDAGQKEATVIAAQAPPELLFGPGNPADPGAFAGIGFGALSDSQQKLLLQLVNEFVADLEPELARNEQRRIAKAGVDKIHFAWAGGEQPGQGHYWRAHGPTFVLEYDNTQNDANHVHALWRDPQNDFGAHWLAEHHATESVKPTGGGK